MYHLHIPMPETILKFQNRSLISLISEQEPDKFDLGNHEIWQRRRQLCFTYLFTAALNPIMSKSYRVGHIFIVSKYIVFLK